MPEGPLGFPRPIGVGPFVRFEDPIDWYSHEIVGCEGDEVIIEDGLENRFTLERERLMTHIREDHGWEEEKIQAFREALDNLCRTG